MRAPVTWTPDSCPAELKVSFISPPTYIKLQPTATCVTAVVTPTGIPSNATGIIANIHTYSTASDHVVHSFGRNTTHGCTTTYQTGPYVTNGYLNDVLISHSGNLASNSAQGHAHGTHFLPLIAGGTLGMVLNMGHVTGTHDLTIQVIGYTSGNGSYFLPWNNINNIRVAQPTQNSTLTGQGPTIPAGVINPQGIFSTITTYYINGNDFFVTTFGRNSSHPLSPLAFAGPYNDTFDTFNDFYLTHAGRTGFADYYGRAHGSHIIPFRAGTTNFDIVSNIFKNDNGASNLTYLVVQAYGYVPAPSYTNIVILPTNQVGVVRLNVTTNNLIVSNIAPPNVPSNSTAILANIYSYQGNQNDWMAHSFGRAANHDANILNAAIYTNATPYYNDVLVTHEGGVSPSFYFGFSHGSNIIPLKSNGMFDAQLGIGKAVASGIHYVVLQVYGYIRRLRSAARHMRSPPLQRRRAETGAAGSRGSSSIECDCEATCSSHHANSTGTLACAGSRFRCGISPKCRARLMALASFRCCLAHTPGST